MFETLVVKTGLSATQLAKYRECATVVEAYRLAYHPEMDREQIARNMLVSLNSRGFNLQKVEQVYSLISKYKNAGIAFAKPARKPRSGSVGSLDISFIEQINQIGTSLSSAREVGETANV